eukprot:1159958-Pelagomonas_calceolata.AAC.11
MEKLMVESNPSRLACARQTCMLTQACAHKHEETNKKSRFATEFPHMHAGMLMMHPEQNSWRGTTEQWHVCLGCSYTALLPTFVHRMTQCSRVCKTCCQWLSKQNSAPFLAGWAV